MRVTATPIVSLKNRLSIANMEMRRTMEANSCVGHLITFVAKVEEHELDREALLTILETCIQEAESRDSDMRLHKFLTEALEYVRYS